MPITESFVTNQPILLIEAVIFLENIRKKLD